jgi:hypothetical protein
MIRQRLWCVIPAFSLFQSGCCIVDSPKIDMAVREGGKYCSVVQIPGAWQLPSPCGSNCSAHLADFAFRWPLESKDTVLIGLKLNEYGGPNGASYTTNGFRLSLSSPSTAVPATDQEWQQAKSAKLFKEALDYKYLQGPRPNLDVRHPDPDRSVWVYEGKKLQKSGNYWFRTVLAPNHGYVALQSFNSDGFISRFGEGNLYIDIYEVTTGKRISLLQGHRCGYEPDYVFATTGWLTNQDFVIPFDFEKRELIFCHFDR